MKLLVIGGQGHVARRLISMLAHVPWVQAVSAAARPAPAGQLELDLTDAAALVQVLGDFEVVVHCPPDSPPQRAQEAQVVAFACDAAGVSRLVFLSGLDVYGRAEGLVSEQALPPCEGATFSDAQAAESHVAAFAAGGATAVILRPGPIFGAGSTQWVGAMAHWLRSGRMGDLGARGDGWSNLVHVDDVCLAIIRAAQLELGAGALKLYNLAAPDSPRWNTYLADLAQAVGATPVRRIAGWQHAADAFVLSPLLQWIGSTGRAGQWAQRLQPWMQGRRARLAQQLRIDPRAAGRELKLDWTPYSVALQDCAQWLASQQPPHPATSETSRRRLTAAFE
jgi:nucleoside-diphosphate-sugar epimerase